MKRAVFPLFAVLAFGCSSSPVGSNRSPEQGVNPSPNDPTSTTDDPSDQEGPGDDDAGSKGGRHDGGGSSGDCVFHTGGTARALTSGWSPVASLATVGLPANATIGKAVWTGHELLA